MKNRKLAVWGVLISLAAVAIFGWYRSSGLPMFGDFSTINSGSGRGFLPTSSANGSRAAAPPQTRIFVGTPQEKSLSTVRLALSQATDLLKFRDTLNEIPNLSLQDRLYYAAAIDEFCHVAAARAGWSTAAKIYSWGGDNPLSIQAPFATELRRDVASQTSDPKKDVRDYARKLQEANSGATLCSGYKSAPVDAVEVNRRIRAAVDAGDQRAIAMLADIAFRESATPIDWGKFSNRSGKPLPNVGLELAVPTEEYTSKLTAAMSTRDPSAILSFGLVLGQSFQTGEYIFAGESLNSGLKVDMWKLVACDFGAPCSSNNNETLLRACAVDGVCEVADLESYFLSYRFNQAEVEQYRRLKPLLTSAIQSGDWSFMKFQAGELPPGASQMTGIYSPFRMPIKLGR